MVRVSRKLKKVDTRPVYIGVPRVAGFYFFPATFVFWLAT